MEHNLAKTYDPKSFEDRIYKDWEESGAFIAQRDPEKNRITSYNVCYTKLLRASAFTVRFPRGPAMAISPPSASTQAGSSAAGSAKATEPQKVPSYNFV